MRPWSCWNRSARPSASSATISPSSTTACFCAARPLGEGRGDLGNCDGLLVAEARPEAHRARRRDFGDRADAVVLWFVDECGSSSGASSSDASIGLSIVDSMRRGSDRLRASRLLAPGPRLRSGQARRGLVGGARALRWRLAFGAERRRGPPCSRLRRSRSIRSTTSAWRGSSSARARPPCPSSCP